MYSQGDYAESTRTLQVIAGLVQGHGLRLAHERHRVLEVEIGLAVDVESAADDINSAWYTR